MSGKKENIDEAEVISVLRKQHYDRIAEAIKCAKGAVAGGNVDGIYVSPGLKLRKKSDGILHTVTTLGMNDTTLKTPKGDTVVVKNDLLDDEFELA